jgi:hypothetical protein
MILTTPHKPMTLVGATSQTFTIESSAKAFQILSNSIYKNPIRAIIRELSCNALDSHTMAGSADSFDIHLPNALESWFSIRDFGTGIAADDIQAIYTTYFRSTKTNSNAQVGALGLGSKSPFSYTETFTVTSWSEGTKSLYIAFIDSSGAPSLSHVGSEPSTERSGFEVLFEVKARDFNTFADEASLFFSTWTTTFPNITGGTLTNRFEPVDSAAPGAVVGSNWTITPKRNNNFKNNTLIVVQGNVPYPIDVTSAFPVIQGTPISPELQAFIDTQADGLTHHHRLIITAPIGTLDFAPSREELQYTNHTKEQLVLMCTNVIRELANLLHKQLDQGGGSKFLTALVYGKNRRQSGMGLAEPTREGLLKISPYLIDGVPFSPANHIVVRRSVLVELDSVLKLRLNVLGTMPPYNASDKARFDREHTIYTFPSRIVGFTVVVKDDGTSALDKIKYNYLRTGSPLYDSARQIVLIEKKHSKVTQQEFDAALAKYLTALGGFPASSVVLSSSLKPSPARATKVKNSFEHLVWTGNVADTRRRYGTKTPATPYMPTSWVQLTDQLDNSGLKKVLYIPRRGNSVVDPTSGETSDRTKVFGNQFAALRQLGLFGSDVVVIGVQPKHIRSVPDSWENVYAYIKRELALVIDEKLAETELAVFYMLRSKSHSRYNVSTITRLVEYYTTQPNGVPTGFLPIIDQYKQCVELGKSAMLVVGDREPHQLIELGGCFDVRPTKTSNCSQQLVAFMASEKILADRYPMLKIVDSDRSYYNMLTTYINMVDNLVQSTPESA